MTDAWDTLSHGDRELILWRMADLKATFKDHVGIDDWARWAINAYGDVWSEADVLEDAVEKGHADGYDASLEDGKSQGWDEAVKALAFLAKLDEVAP